MWFKGKFNMLLLKDYVEIQIKISCRNNKLFRTKPVNWMKAYLTTLCNITKRHW